MLHQSDHCYTVEHGPFVHSDIRSISPELSIYSVIKYFTTLKAANKYISSLKPSERFYLRVTLTTHYDYKEDFKI